MQQLKESFARAHRMLLYLLMALVLLVMVGVNAYFLAIVFLFFLWSDNGDIAVPLREAGHSVPWIVGRLGLDVLPLAVVSLLAWLLTPDPLISGSALLICFGFYLISRHRLGERAKALSA